MNMETPADALTRQVAENLSKSGPKPTRRRPNFLLIESEREQHAAEMVSLLADRESLQDRLARGWKWQLFAGFVGFLVGAIVGKLL